MGLLNFDRTCLLNGRVWDDFAGESSPSAFFFGRGGGGGNLKK